MAMMIALPVASANDFCAKLDKSGISNGDRFDNTDNLYKVGGKGHLQFYSAPDEKCLLKGHLLCQMMIFMPMLSRMDFIGSCTSLTMVIKSWAGLKRQIACNPQGFGS